MIGAETGTVEELRAATKLQLIDFSGVIPTLRSFSYSACLIE